MVASFSKFCMSVEDMVGVVVGFVPVTVTAGRVVTSDDVPAPASPVVVVVCVGWLRFNVAVGNLVPTTWNGSITVTPGASVETAPPRAAPLTLIVG